jgi:hypothetical protein
MGALPLDHVHLFWKIRFTYTNAGINIEAYLLMDRKK